MISKQTEEHDGERDIRTHDPGVLLPVLPETSASVWWLGKEDKGWRVDRSQGYDLLVLSGSQTLAGNRRVVCIWVSYVHW